MAPGSLHQSVLTREVLELTEPRQGQIWVDATVGLGGHAFSLLERIGPLGRLIGFDKDAQALEEARRTLANFGDRVVLVHDDFRNIAKHLKAQNVQKVQGILADLGVSSLQLDRPDRGFSFAASGPLDMRMDSRQTFTAKDIVNQYSKTQLEDMLYQFGEERFARRIVAKILESRQRERIETTGDLEKVIWQAVPASYRHGRLHPATRTFQALRIAVNEELQALGDFLDQAPHLLAEQSHLAVISFHSLEDRLVKRAFKAWQTEGKGRIVTKKPVRPGAEEMAANPRARSAKLRVFEVPEASSQ